MKNRDEKSLGNMSNEIASGWKLFNVASGDDNNKMTKKTRSQTIFSRAIKIFLAKFSSSSSLECHF